MFLECFCSKVRQAITLQSRARLLAESVVKSRDRERQYLYVPGECGWCRLVWMWCEWPPARWLWPPSQSLSPSVSRRLYNARSRCGGGAMVQRQHQQQQPPRAAEQVTASRQRATPPWHRIQGSRHTAQVLDRCSLVRVARLQTPQLVPPTT